MVNIRPLSAALTKRAREELNEKPEEIEARINELKEWILTQPHLKARTDDQFLVSFLRGSKYDMKLAKQKIDLFFTMRSLMPELNENREMKYGKIAEIMKLGVSIPLPMTDGEAGPRMFLIRPGHYDPKKYDLTDMIKYYCMLTDILLMDDDNFIVGGLLGILDFSNVTNEHLVQFNPLMMKKMTLFSQDSSPIHISSFHYINTPKGFDFLFNMLKTFMTEENQRNLYVHGYDLESLYRYVPKRFLPAEYGGENGTVQSLTDYWENKILEKRDEIKEWENYGTNELLRPGAPITEETIMERDSSFFFQNT